MTYRDALAWGTEKLKKSPSSHLDAEILLGLSFGRPREKIIMDLDHEIANKPKITKFKKYVKRRAKGEPMAYIRGSKEFYGMDFIVNKNVLVPRPDTELIVEIVRDVGNAGIVMDVGTGSGCIPVTLKKYLPKAEIIGTDISEKALTVARKNAKKHKIGIKFYKSDLFKQIPKNLKGKINIITFNPPYLTKNEASKKELAYEPQVALTPPDFRKLIKDFFIQAREYLTDDGSIFMEIGHRQGKIVSKIAGEIFSKAKIEVIKDLGGFDRVMKIRSSRP